VENIKKTASPSDRRRAIDYLRRKARSIEIQSARAAPAVAAQLRSLAASMQIEAEQLERASAI
jgi:hypothetical protein